eukprot:3092684-Rhodomonas_salina.1
MPMHVTGITDMVVQCAWYRCVVLRLAVMLVPEARVLYCGQPLERPESQRPMVRELRRYSPTRSTYA